MRDRLPTHWSVSIFPLAEDGGVHGQDQLFHGGWAGSVGRTQYSLSDLIQQAMGRHRTLLTRLGVNRLTALPRV